jgi:hypothetical protein
MTVDGDWEDMARKELVYNKKTSCVINPLPGYD